MRHEEILQLLHDETLAGNVPAVRAAVEDGLTSGLEPARMPFEAPVPSLEDVGARFERGDYFVSETLIAARALHRALDILRALPAGSGAASIGSVVIGTVEGDVHDIGKNLCNIMLEGAGFTVVDPGVNVPPERSVEEVARHAPDVVGFSAFPMTPMPMFKANITALKKAGSRERVIVTVAGAPVAQESADAAAALRTAEELIEGCPDQVAA